MAEISQNLSFKLVDDLAIAANQNALGGSAIANRQAPFVGPWLELRRLQAGNRRIAALGSDWIVGNEIATLWSELDAGRKIWTHQGVRRLGFIRTRHGAESDRDWTRFTLEAKRAGIASGLTDDLAGQVVSALDELMDNVMEHSRAPRTGVAAYAQGDGIFEIIVYDEGVGVLKSLQTATEFGGLVDHGEALRLFIEEGVSRFGRDVGRGLGFRPLFTGLANAQCSLRFRSGDHAMEIDGTKLHEAPANLIQTTYLDGLICAIRCQQIRRPERE